MKTQSEIWSAQLGRMLKRARFPVGFATIASKVLARRSAVLIPGAPWAWTVTFFLWRWTSSTAAGTSSSV